MRCPRRPRRRRRACAPAGPAAAGSPGGAPGTATRPRGAPTSPTCGSPRSSPTIRCRHESRAEHLLRVSPEPGLRRLVWLLLRRLSRRRQEMRRVGCKLLHENYPDHYHWNFADNGWAVHGHAKEYIAYYNWTFGGQCGLGRVRPSSRAAIHGRPVRISGGRHLRRLGAAVRPTPRVTAITPTLGRVHVGPGGGPGRRRGPDFFVSGLDHYIVVADGERLAEAAAARLERARRARCRKPDMKPGETACLHVHRGRQACRTHRRAGRLRGAAWPAADAGLARGADWRRGESERRRPGRPRLVVLARAAPGRSPS